MSPFDRTVKATALGKGKEMQRVQKSKTSWANGRNGRFGTSAMVSGRFGRPKPRGPRGLRAQDPSRFVHPSQESERLCLGRTLFSS